MGWINEYSPLLPHSAKQPDLDYYLFLSIGFIVVAFTTIKETKDNGILNRNQTEEWKGWMQMQFLMYHYLHQVHPPRPRIISSPNCCCAGLILAQTAALPASALPALIDTTEQ